MVLVWNAIVGRAMGRPFAKRGLMLREIATDLWAVETPFEFMGMDMGARMTVVRRADGDLFVYGPFAIMDDDEAAIRDKGNVRDIVASNTAHFTEIDKFKRRFPDATLWALPELDKKLENIPHRTLEQVPDSWKNDFDCELFDGPRGFREWVFCHRASKSLLVTDIAFQLPPPTTPLNKIASKLNDVGEKFGASRFERTLMKLGDTDKEKQHVTTILNWDFERIVPGHGFVTNKNAKHQLHDAYLFLGI